MSLILGVNLPKYLYLVCDTRLTRKSGGKNIYQDNFLKFHNFNDDISMVVAGNASLASYILRKLSNNEIIKKGFVFFENNIEKVMKEILNEYMKEGGTFFSTFMIFAGFDKSSKKQINTSQYGKALVGNFVPGKKSTLNMDIVNKIIESGIKNGGDGREGVIGKLEKDAIIETDDIYSSIITVKIDLPSGLEINKVDCYKYIMRAPNGVDENNLPKEIGYKIEELQSKNVSGIDTIQEQTVTLMAWVNNVIKENELSTVGGDILVYIITPEGACIMTGCLQCLDKNTKEIKKISEIIVHNKEFCVRSETGEIIPLENIHDFNDDGEFEI